MPSPRLRHIRDRLEPLRSQLVHHPVYEQIADIEDLRVFMQWHVFAVWDFMSLLKALQQALCCVTVPWTPSRDSAACRLVNLIVLGEESDEDGSGGFASHYELYRRAMRECGASTQMIDRFVDVVRDGRPVAFALDSIEAPQPVRAFVTQTFDIIARADVCALASAFTFGREDLLPDVFRRIVDELDTTTDGRLAIFRYYLDRHIALDGDEHGPMASRLVERLAGGSDAKWQTALDAAVTALESRIALWDGISTRLRSQNHAGD